MGVSSKEPLALVKEEMAEGCKGSAFNIGSGMQWPFSNKVSSLPHTMSFKVAQEGKPKKTVPVPLGSSAFMPISTSDAFDLTQRRFYPEIQKSFNNDKQGGSKMFPVSNQTISVSMGNHQFFEPLITKATQNHGEISVMHAHSALPSFASILGNNTKGPEVSAQLTIFYAGSVNVYDDVSPEKAQAIMLLAGNSAPISQTQKAQAQAPSSKLAATEGIIVSQPINTQHPGSGLSSPISVSSHPKNNSGSGSNNTEEIVVAKTTGVSISPVTMIPAVPMARKASLARFLEKRKERVMGTAPYNPEKKSPERASVGHNGSSSSASSGALSGSFQSEKQ